jgi:WD40 repeat protein
VVKVWDSNDGTPLAVFTGHTQGVRGVAFGADGGVVYSGGEDGTLRRWPVTFAV